MRVKRLLALAARLLQPMLLTQFFALPPLFEVDRQAPLSQEAVEVFFADLQRTECTVPLAPLALLCHRLDIFHDHVSQRQDLVELHDDPCFRLPAATG